MFSRTPIMILALVALAACQPAPSGTAIRDVTVIDAVNGVREHRTVVFDGDEITAVQPAGADIEAARTIDGSGKYLIPGLWDFHVHLTYRDELKDSLDALFLSYGITSVRDTGGLMDKILPVVERMRADGALAPRVFFAGPLLDGRFVVYDGDTRTEIGVRNATPEQARATIRELAAQGVDFIKIYEMVSPEVFDAMVATANELGLPIASHVPLSMRASIAGAEVDSIEHLRNIEMDCAADAPSLHETRLELLKNPDGLPGGDLRAQIHALQRLPAIAAYDEARCDRTLEALHTTMQVPTLRLLELSLEPPFGRDDWEDALSRLPESVATPWRQAGLDWLASDEDRDTTFAEWALFLTGRAHAAGIPIAAGTDMPLGYAVPGYSLHSELEFLVRAGLTPLEALESATIKPAEFFSLEDQMGTVEPGKRADLVLLDADPLQDIANTRRIAAVVTKGRFLSSDELAALVDGPAGAPAH